MEKISIVGKETKKHIAEALKAVFPGFKFSLVSDFDTVSVRWVDGPMTADVTRVLNRFESYTRVLAHTDYTKATGYEWKGAVYVGARYLNATRQLSNDRRTAIISFMDEAGQSFINATVRERAVVESMMIGQGLLSGVLPVDRPELMRDQAPIEDQRPKPQAQTAAVRPASVETEPVQQAKVIQFRPRQQTDYAAGLTPEQQLKLHVIQSLFQKDFLTQAGMNVDEAFTFVATELFGGGQGR